MMLQIHGYPFLYYVLKLLASKGLRRVVICVAYRAQAIMDYVRDGKWLDLEVSYCYDGSQIPGWPVGTAAALRHALPQLGDHFWTVNGDTYADIDYSAMYRHYRSGKSPSLIAVYKNDNRRWPSNVALLPDGRCTYRKRSWTSGGFSYIDTGTCILEASILNAHIQYSSLSELFEYLGDCGRLAAYEVNARFYEINTPDSLEETAHHLTDIGEYDRRRSYGILG